MVRPAADVDVRARRLQQCENLDLARAGRHTWGHCRRFTFAVNHHVEAGQVAAVEHALLEVADVADHLVVTARQHRPLRPPVTALSAGRDLELLSAISSASSSSSRRPACAHQA